MTHDEEISIPTYSPARSSKYSVQRPPPGPISRMLDLSGICRCSTLRTMDFFHSSETVHSSPSALQSQASQISLLSAALFIPGIPRLRLSRSMSPKDLWAKLLDT